MRSLSINRFTFLFTITDDSDFSALWRYKSVQDSGHTGWFEIIPASLDGFVARVRKWRVFQPLCILHAHENWLFRRCRHRRCCCFYCRFVLRFVVAAVFLVPGPYACTFNEELCKNLKKTESTRARMHGVMQSCESRCPPSSRTVRLSVRSWPNEHTTTGPEPDDAIAIHERQSHPRRFKNVDFPSPEAIRDPIWQKRDTGSITSRGRLWAIQSSTQCPWYT